MTIQTPLRFVPKGAIKVTKPDLTLTNRIAVCVCEAAAVGFAIAVFAGWWVATP